MTVASGQLGTIIVSAAEILDVTSWELTGEAVTTRYGSNSTAGYKATVAGKKHYSGTIEAKWDSAGTAGEAPNTVLREGQSVTVQLDVTDVTHYGFQGIVIIKSFRLKVDIDDGTVTGCVIGFESHGQLAQGTP